MTSKGAALELQTQTTPDLASPNRGVIEVRIKEIDQLFNSIDPAPFREKDIDDDANEFIVGWAKEMPLQKELTLLVHMNRLTAPPDAEDVVREAIHVFYKHRAELATQRLHQLFREGRISLLIGLTFLALCVLAGDSIARRYGDNRLGEIANESLLIGGWVAMWRPMEIFLYAWWPIRFERKIFNRLSRMTVKIQCTGQPDGRGKTVC